MLLSDILNHKGHAVLTIEPTATLAEVVRTLVEHNCGSLIVCATSGDGLRSRMVGIITERDILRACANEKSTLERTHVEDVMSKNPVTGRPSDSVEETMGVMTDRRIRHLPVLDGGKLAGLVSIGDLVKAQHDAMTMENHYLKSYLHG
jgi:CBS domain-containing protein